MRVNLVLDLVDASLELVDGPALLYLHRPLRDDGTAVVVAVGKVDRHARDLDAVVEGVLNGVRPLEAGQQRRVNVDHAVGKAGKNGVVHHPHVARHKHVVHTSAAQLGGYDLVGNDWVSVDLLGERKRLDARLLRTLEPVRAWPRTHH